MTDQQYNDLCTAIPIGGPHDAISRKELARRWDTADREVRKRIAELRAYDNGDPYVICSSSHSANGYYRTEDREAILQYVAETRSRALSTFRPLTKAKRILAERDSEWRPRQMTMTCNLAALREGAHITQDLFVRAMRAYIPPFDRMLLSKAENGHAMLTPDQLRAAALILDCRPEEIYPSEQIGDMYGV